MGKVEVSMGEDGTVFVELEKSRHMGEVIFSSWTQRRARRRRSLSLIRRWGSAVSG